MDSSTGNHLGLHVASSRNGAVPDYHIYRIDETNHIIGRHDCIEPDDLAAIARAKELCGPHEVEVWQLARLVARLAKDGTASLQPDSGPRTR
jgi:hypothetical protein